MLFGRPFTRTQAQGAGDFYDATAAGSKIVMKVLGIRLVPAAAAATAQITDQDGTVLANLAAPANGPADEVKVAIAAVGKVSLAAIAGAGSSVTVYME